MPPPLDFVWVEGNLTEWVTTRSPIWRTIKKFREVEVSRNFFILDDLPIESLVFMLLHEILNSSVAFFETQGKAGSQFIQRHFRILSQPFQGGERFIGIQIAAHQSILCLFMVGSAATTLSKRPVAPR